MPNLAARYARLPLSFEPNLGQTDARVKFLARAQGYTLFLSPNESVLAVAQAQAGAAALRIKLVGANSKAHSMGLVELPGKSNYFIGNDRSKWRTNIPHFAKARFEDVYPGIDLVYYGSEGEVEHDFVLAPGADPNRIRLEIEGAEGIELDASGDAVLRVPRGELRLHKPTVYQEVAGQRREVAGRFVRRGPNRLGFKVGTYDRNVELVIDPVLAYSTYLGGNQYDELHGLAVDSAGNAHVTGFTLSANFPATSGAFDSSFAPGRDGFLTKLDPNGNVVFSTFLGGSGVDEGGGVTLDSAGNIYVTGVTQASDFPVTTGTYQATFGGGVDAFVAKLDPTGSTLLYSTYLGGGGDDAGTDIKVDGAGTAYISCNTTGGFPATTGAFQTSYGGDFRDGCAAKLDSGGASLLYATYLGGSGADHAFSIAIDASGSAYVGLLTQSSNFPITLGAFSTTFQGGGEDGALVKLNPLGSTLVYSTYIGSPGQDGIGGVAVDNAGNAYLSGRTGSAAFPVTFGAYQTTYGGGANDAFVAKLNSSGSALLFSTFLGGSGSDDGGRIQIDSGGAAYVAGNTDSTNFPTLNPVQSANAGSSDGFVSKLDSSGSSVLFSTYMGGAAFDLTGGIGLGPGGAVYVAGTAQSNNFPTTIGVAQSTFGGGIGDAFVARIGCAIVGLEHPLAALVPDSDPVPLPDHAFKKGRTLPLKLQMSCTDDGSAPRIVGLVRIGDPPLDLSTIDLDAGQSNDSGVLFRFEDGSWIYNLSTKGLATGIYTITIELPDGQRYTAGFVLR